MSIANSILANFQISERGTNERRKFKKRNIPKFPIHYYTKIAAKTGTHDKIILFLASKRGTVPPKEEQLASMFKFWLEEFCLHHFDSKTPHIYIWAHKDGNMGDVSYKSSVRWWKFQESAISVLNLCVHQILVWWKWNCPIVTLHMTAMTCSHHSVCVYGWVEQLEK